jgi:hypothetical protein
MNIPMLSFYSMGMIYMIYTITMGVRCAVWFGFEHKNYPNREIKIHAVQFGSIDF